MPSVRTDQKVVSQVAASGSRVNTDDWLADARTSYDTVADSYAGQLREALDGRIREPRWHCSPIWCAASAAGPWPTWAAGPDTSPRTGRSRHQARL